MIPAARGKSSRPRERSLPDSRRIAIQRDFNHDPCPPLYRSGPANSGNKQRVITLTTPARGLLQASPESRKPTIVRRTELRGTIPAYRQADIDIHPLPVSTAESLCLDKKLPCVGALSSRTTSFRFVDYGADDLYFAPGSREIKPSFSGEGLHGGARHPASRGDNAQMKENPGRR